MEDNNKYIQGKYHNVIYPKLIDSEKLYTGELADPHILDGEDGYYYIFSTGGVAFRSKDMCDWELYSNCVIDKYPTWNNEHSKGKCGLWAPDCFKCGNKWIYIYSLSVWGGEWECGIGYATSDKPEGPYIDQGKLFTSDEIGLKNSIDPGIVFDEDNHLWVYWGSFRGIGLVRLNDDGCGLYGGLEYAKKNLKIIVGTNGSSLIEGTYIKKLNGYYYLWGSKGSCCEGKNSKYAVVVGRSKSLFGPYLGEDGLELSETSPMVVSGGGEDMNIVGPGHNSLFIDDAGDYWMIYHGYEIGDDYATRHLFMDKLVWSESGFPRIESKKSRRGSYNEVLDGPKLLKNKY